MSIFYSIEGTVKVRPCAEVAQIVDAFNDIGGECSADYDEEEGTVVVEGGTFCSHARSGELDTKIQELGVYATEPTFLTTNYDGEVVRLYIGPPGEEGKSRSADALAEIRQLLPSLTADDKALLAGELGGQQGN